MSTKKNTSKKGNPNVRKGTTPKAGRHSSGGGKNRGKNGRTLGGPRAATGTGYGAAQLRHNRQTASANSGDPRLTKQADLAAQVGNFAELPEWERQLAGKFTLYWLLATPKRGSNGRFIMSREKMAAEMVRSSLREEGRKKEASSAQLSELLQRFTNTFNEASDQMYANA